jgi:hypothetical protein
MTKTSKHLLLFAATVVLGACAHVQVEWRSSTGATPSQLQKDAADCEFKARLAMLPAILGIAERSTVGELEMCMNARGYYQIEKKDAGEVKGPGTLVAQGESAHAWMRPGQRFRAP